MTHLLITLAGALAWLLVPIAVAVVAAVPLQIVEWRHRKGTRR